MKSNVYAFGMLIHELLLRKEPYQDDDHEVQPYPLASNNCLTQTGIQTINRLLLAVVCCQPAFSTLHITDDHI